MDIPSNIDEQTARRIIELSVARPDMGDRSIAERLGLSRHAVRTVRSSVGLRTDHRADYARIVAALKRWPYLGMHQIADRLSVSRDTVYRVNHRYRIRPKRVTSMSVED